jgi:hypothetical protein
MMQKGRQIAEQMKLSKSETYLYLQYLIGHPEQSSYILALPDEFLEMHVTDTLQKEKRGRGLA